MVRNKGFAHIEIIIVIILIVIVGALVFVVGNPFVRDGVPARPEISPTANVEGGDWESYQGENISFKYPSKYVYFIDDNDNVHFFETEAELKTCQQSGNCYASLEFTFAGVTEINDTPRESELVEPRRIDFEGKGEWLIESVEAQGIVYIAYSTNNNPNLKVRIEGGKKAIENRAKYLDLFDQTLSTFEFLD